MVFMNIIYLDTLFFVNCITDYITLLCAGVISGAVIHRKSIAFASVLGGLYACACVSAVGVWMGHFCIRLAFGIFLCLLAFGGETRLLRCCICFFCVSALFGGIFSAISYNGISYISIDVKLLVVTFAVCYVLLSAAFRCFARNQNRERRTARITMRQQTVELQVLRDTGNELIDPISNAPVMICQRAQIEPLFPVSLKGCQADPYAAYLMLSEHGIGSKLRLIPYQSVHGNGVLLGFIPDSVEIDNVLQETVIAITEQVLSHDNTYQGII